MADVFTLLEGFLFEGGIFGSSTFFALGIILLFAMLLWSIRVPPLVVLIMLSPIVLIGGGSLISSAIPIWIKVLLVMGTFLLLGIGYMVMSSGNK